VREGIVGPVVEEPRVAAAPFQPGPERRRPVAAGRVHPADEHLRERAFLEELARAADDVS
jgi:hypothetical protein